MLTELTKYASDQAMRDRIMTMATGESALGNLPSFPSWMTSADDPRSCRTSSGSARPVDRESLDLSPNLFHFSQYPAPARGVGPTAFLLFGDEEQTWCDCGE